MLDILASLTQERLVEPPLLPVYVFDPRLPEASERAVGAKLDRD
jgi:hypothetical protein